MAKFLYCILQLLAFLVLGSVDGVNSNSLIKSRSYFSRQHFSPAASRVGRLTKRTKDVVPVSLEYLQSAASYKQPNNEKNNLISILNEESKRIADVLRIFGLSSACLYDLLLEFEDKPKNWPDLSSSTQPTSVSPRDMLDESHTTQGVYDILESFLSQEISSLVYIGDIAACIGDDFIRYLTQEEYWSDPSLLQSDKKTNNEASDLIEEASYEEAFSSNGPQPMEVSNDTPRLRSTTQRREESHGSSSVTSHLSSERYSDAEEKQKNLKQNVNGRASSDVSKPLPLATILGIYKLILDNCPYSAVVYYGVDKNTYLQYESNLLSFLPLGAAFVTNSYGADPKKIVQNILIEERLPKVVKMMWLNEIGISILKNDTNIVKFIYKIFDTFFYPCSAYLRFLVFTGPSKSALLRETSGVELFDEVSDVIQETVVNFFLNEFFGEIMSINNECSAKLEWESLPEGLMKNTYAKKRHDHRRVQDTYRTVHEILKRMPNINKSLVEALMDSLPDTVTDSSKIDEDAKEGSTQNAAGKGEDSNNEEIDLHCYEEFIFSDEEMET